MNSLIFYFCLFSLLSIANAEALSQEKKFIIISFSFKFINYATKYNSTNFLYDYFKREINLKFSVGTPMQNIKALIDQNSECFKFEQDKNIYNNNIIYNRYFPNISSTFIKKDSKIKNNQNFEISSDKFIFSRKDKFIMEFIINNNTEIKNNYYIPTIGLNIPTFSKDIKCPNFILDLKKEGSISKIMWSITYENKYDGKLIIGDDLSKYNPTKFPKSNYSSLYLTSKYTIPFDSICIADRWYKMISSKKSKNNSIKANLNMTQSIININLGFIIGTSEYKNYIDSIYFERLINKSICKIDIVKYEANNFNDINFNNEYYVYSCSDRLFTGQTSLRYPGPNFYKDFPKLIFTSKQLEYNFELENKNLFEKVYERYYFLIIFKKNNTSKGKEIWHLGEPFYKKYSFSINSDGKSIGFYTDKIKNNFNLNKHNFEKKNISVNKIIKYTIVIIIFFGLLFLAYYIGLTVKGKRKKRAFELKDDNYEYLSEKDKNINSPQNDSKKRQLVELNSRLGL